MPNANKISKNTIPTAPSVVHKRPKKVALGRLFFALVLIASLSAAGYYYMQYRSAKEDTNMNDSQKNQAETDRVLASLRNRLLITETEAPTVARVEEPDTLKQTNAEFYKDIQKGDYLVIFPKRAVIYREPNDQIINVAPIVDTTESDTASATIPDSTVGNTGN